MKEEIVKQITEGTFEEIKLGSEYYDIFQDVKLYGKVYKVLFLTGFIKGQVDCYAYLNFDDDTDEDDFDFYIKTTEREIYESLRKDKKV